MPVVLGTPACVPVNTIAGVTVDILSGEPAPPTLKARRGRRRARSDPQADWVSQNLAIADGFGNSYVYSKELGGGYFAKAYLFVSETTDERLAVRVEWEGKEIDLPPALGTAEGLMLARTKSFFKARLQVMELGVSTAEDFFLKYENAEYLPQFECFVKALLEQLMANRLTYYDLKPDNIVVCRCPSKGFLYFRAIDIDSVGSLARPKQDAFYRIDTRTEGVVAPPAYSVVFTAFAALLTIYLARKLVMEGPLDVQTFWNKWKWKKADLRYSDNFLPAARHWRSMHDFDAFFEAVGDIVPTQSTAEAAWEKVKPVVQGCIGGYKDRVAIM